MFNIDGKVIDIFSYGEDKDVPVVLLNSFEREEGEKVFNECKTMGLTNFALVSISGIDWDNEMSPFALPRLFKYDNGYKGKALEYLKFLENKVIPKVQEELSKIGKTVSYYVIAGYSLGGLFALYSIYNTNTFKKCMSASGSLWYPNFLEYTLTYNISKNVDKVYLSLGDKEDKTKNEILSKVKENTEKIYETLKANVECKYEVNEGNHFADVEKRIAKGIVNLIK